MKTLPFLGQFLGRLCWNPCVTADGEWPLTGKQWTYQTQKKWILIILCFMLNRKPTIHMKTTELILSCVLLSAATSRRLLFQCLWGLYSEHPGNAVERKANQWIRVWTKLFYVPPSIFLSSTSSWHVQQLANFFTCPSRNRAEGFLGGWRTNCKQHP